MITRTLSDSWVYAKVCLCPAAIINFKRTLSKRLTSIFLHTDSHDNYHMIFEYATDGSLREYLEKNFVNLQWRDKLKLGLEIASGLRYLHDLDIIHKDLVCAISKDCFSIRVLE